MIPGKGGGFGGKGGGFGMDVLATSRSAADLRNSFKKAGRRCRLAGGSFRSSTPCDVNLQHTSSANA